MLKMVEKSSLMIHKMENTNCGAFKGTHTLEFSIDKEKNITIVIGDNGRGKSTTFRLIYWCLFGKFFKPKTENTFVFEGLMNKSILKKLEVGKKVTSSVTLTINDEDGEKYVLTRSLTATKKREESGDKFEKLNNSRVYRGIQIETEVKMRMMDPREDRIYTETNESIINTELRPFLPQELSDFALFDGEKLVNFQTPEGAKELIIDGIQKLSGLPIVDSLIISAKHTETGIRIFTGKKEGVDGEALANTLEQTKEDINQYEIEIKELLITEKENKILYDEILYEMGRSESGKDISSRILKQQQIISSLKKEDRKNNSLLKEFLFRKIPYMLMRKTLLKAQTDFTRLQELQKIPPPMSSDDVDQLRNALVCICGRKFEKDDDVWKELGRVKEKVIDTEFSTGISEGRGLISQIVDQSIPENVFTRHDALDETATNYFNQLRLENSKLDDLKDERSHLPREGELDFNALQNKSESLWRENAKLGLKLKETRQLLEDEIEKEEKLEKKLTDATGHGEKHRDDLDKMDILKAIQKISAEKKKIITGKLRTLTEQSTDKYFMKTAPQKDDFSGVQLTSNYDILALDSDGEPKETSMGQSHVLGLSYIMGCRSIANTNTFLFIDSPLHNVSGQFRNEVSDVLAKYLPDVQIVLFVTDTEYISGDKDSIPVREKLKPTNKVWREYEIGICETADGETTRCYEEYVE